MRLWLAGSIVVCVIGLYLIVRALKPDTRLPRDD